MTSNPQAPEAMEWQREGAEDQRRVTEVGGEEPEGGDELSRPSAPCVETTVTHLSRSYSADQTAGSPRIAIGFLLRYRKRRTGGRQTPEPPTDPIMRIQIARLAKMLTRFDPTLTDSQDKQHLAFNSLPANIVLLAQEVLKVKMQLKSQVQIVGRELARIDDPVQLPDLELHKVEEQFAVQVGARLEGIQGRHARHEAVTSQLHKVVHGTDEQSIHQDFMLDREIVRVNEQHKRELEIHEISINLMKQELQQNQEAQKKRDCEISEHKTQVETLMDR